MEEEEESRAETGHFGAICLCACWGRRSLVCILIRVLLCVEIWLGVGVGIER